MGLSLDDSRRNESLEKAGEELAKELAVLIKQKYPTQGKILQYKCLLGSGRMAQKKLLCETLASKLCGLLGIEHEEAYPTKDCEVMLEEIFAIIKDNYSDDKEKLQTYIAVLEGCDCIYTFWDILRVEL